MLTDEVGWWVSFHISEKPRSRFPNPRLAQQWRERLDRFDGSELTIAEFCELEGYSQTSFYQWRRRLAVDPQPDAPAFVAVDHSAHDHPNHCSGGHHSGGHRAGDHRSGPIEVELPGGARVKVAAGLQWPEYRNLIAAIVEATTKPQATDAISTEVNS